MNAGSTKDAMSKVNKNFSEKAAALLRLEEISDGSVAAFSTVPESGVVHVPRRDGESSASSTGSDTCSVAPKIKYAAATLDVQVVAGSNSGACTQVHRKNLRARARKM
jgi:hypothetical protein